MSTATSSSDRYDAVNAESDTPKYSVQEWECDAEYGGDADKFFLVIVDAEGEEYALIGHRTCNGKYPLEGDVAQEKVARAQSIVNALNAAARKAEAKGHSTSITWEDPEPPTSGRGSDPWGRKIAQLDEEPGRWALIAENTSNGKAYQLRQQYPLYEFTARGHKDGRVSKLYGRRRAEEDLKA